MSCVEVMCGSGRLARLVLILILTLRVWSGPSCPLPLTLEDSYQGMPSGIPQARHYRGRAALKLPKLISEGILDRRGTDANVRRPLRDWCMLTKIKIRNFKRFDNVEVDLGNPVVFIGPNNSGKTSALQAVALWQEGLSRWNE